MEWIKKLTKKKYFYLVFFFVLVLVLAFTLHIVIDNDRKANEPSDGMIRVSAKVINDPSTYTTVDNGESHVMYNDVRISVKLSDNESYECPIIGQIDKDSAGSLEYGSAIRVKYNDSNHQEFYFADDPPERHRTFLYAILIILIVLSIGGVFFSSRLLDVMRHKKVMAENMENVRKQNEMREQDGTGYNPDGVDNRYDPFADKQIDYNAMYEENQKLSDASYSADSTYSGLDDGTGSAPESGTYYDPNAKFGGSAGEQTDASYGGYGAPNASMDAPFDPNATYGGYGAPNASMDAPFDPNATYGGYGAPNASMDAPFDPNATYGGYGAPNASMDAPFDPNATYGASETSGDEPFYPNRPRGGR